MFGWASGGKLVLAVAVAIGATAPAWGHGTTERVSVGPGGVQANDGSIAPAISGGGRSVAFQSFATNLVRGDTNGVQDVFVRDRQTGTTRRVSLGPGGAQGNASSLDPALSADSRSVAFWSLATNLVPGDTNGSADVFLRDRQAGTTRRLSLGPGGAQADRASFAPAVSADGRFVAFTSNSKNLVPGDTNSANDVFVRDRQTGTTRRVSLGPSGVQGDNASGDVAISADGRFVAFDSFVTNLVPDDSNGAQDVFVRDRQTGITRRVSVGPSDAQGNGVSRGPAVSAHGGIIAFDSSAPNLVRSDTNGEFDVFVRVLRP